MHYDPVPTVDIRDPDAYRRYAARLDADVAGWWNDDLSRMAHELAVLARERRAVDIAISVRAEIRAELGRQQHSQNWLAGQLGLHRNTMWETMRGATDLSVERLAQIAVVLGVPICQFFPGGNQ